MKFCYIDESGTGQESIAVMVGIIVDHTRMNLTKRDWAELLDECSEKCGRNVEEIHTRDLYSGNSPFRQLNTEERTGLINTIIQWLFDRKHSIVFSAVDKRTFNSKIELEPFYKDIGTLWRHMAFHLVLSIQKRFQTFNNNKGNCLLIFDNKVDNQREFTRLLLSPPTWSDTYYSKGEKQSQLDQIIDVPHFVDSKEVGLIQIADFISYFLRKHIELNLGLKSPKYNNEKNIISNYANHLIQLSIPRANTFLAKGRCNASVYFCKFAPQCDIIIK